MVRKNKLNDVMGLSQLGDVDNVCKTDRRGCGVLRCLPESSGVVEDAVQLHYAKCVLKLVSGILRLSTLFQTVLYFLKQHACKTLHMMS